MSQKKQTNYRSRKQVIKDCVETGAMTEDEAKILERSVVRADRSYQQGRMFLDLKEVNEVVTNDFKKKLEKNELTPAQRKTLHVVRVNNIPKPHLDVPEETAKACKNYLEIMVEDGMSPSMNGLSLALGIPLKRLIAIQNGEEKNASSDVITTTIQMIATSNEVAIRNSGAVGEMFIAKNYHGMQDKQTVEHTDRKVEMTDDELKEKYDNFKVVDVIDPEDYKE